MPNLLSPVPQRSPVTDNNGLPTPVWSAWFRDLAARVGGTVTVTLSDLATHLAAITGAHPASAIINVPSGNLAATNAQGALNELQSDIDTRATSAALTSHTGASTGVHGVTGSVVGTSDTQVLTNKTLTGAKVSDYEEFTEQGSSPSNPTSGKRRVYVKTDGKAYILDSTGTEVALGSGSSGGINYILNPDAESNTAGWTTYADAAGAMPVDGTGGSPSVTWTRSTSAPLRGVAVFLMTKGASNRQGDGVAYDFTIDSADALYPQMQKTSFDYAGSAAFHFGSDPVTDISDAVIYLIDKTSGEVIQPSTFILDGSGHFSTDWQPNYGHTDYRVVIHIGTTNASAWTLKADNFQTGPGTKIRGVPVTDWQDYTPTFSAGFGTVTTPNVKWRRVGDTLEVRGTFVTGTTTGALGTIGLPSGLSIDTTKFASYANYTQRIGFADRLYFSSLLPLYNQTTAGTAFAMALDTTSPTTAYMSFKVGSGIYNGDPVNGMVGNTEGIYFEFRAPILGWSSNLAMSDSAISRIITARVSGAVSSTAANTAILFPTKDFDNSGSYDPATGLFTARYPGFIDVKFFVQAGTSVAYSVWKNGAQEKVAALSDATFGYATGATQVQVVAGDTLSIRPGATSGAILSTSWASFTYVTGPSQIATSDTVTATYTGSATTGYGNSTDTLIAPTTKVKDSNNAYSAGVFTCPISGTYKVNAAAELGGTASASTAVTVMKVFVNATPYTVGYAWAPPSGTQSVVASVNGFQVPCNAGDTISVKVNSINYASLSLLNTYVGQWVSIARVGNY